jgi:beta-glucosidase
MNDSNHASSLSSTGRTFPVDFVWGVATAAAQIEGAAFEDGKSASVWDTFARKPGAVHNGDTLDVACDHYHRYPEDLTLMAKLGFKHYRFSIAWPRIVPDGVGSLNPRGLDFYDRLIDAMMAKAITPWVTMFHWDLPQALEDKGGWRVPLVADAFADYADTIVKRYGDRVKHWITLNEIVCFTRLAYGGMRKAPGVVEPEAVINQTYHHALLCHGHGVRAVREHGGPGARVGLTDNSQIPVPVLETEEHIKAAREIFVSANTRILEPIYKGRYHPAYLESAGQDAPKFKDEDFKLISLKTDFLGLNTYSGSFARAGADGRAERVDLPPSYPQADSPWLKLNARSLYWGTRHAAEVYGVENVYITENGAGYDDLPPANGEVLDLHRLEYVRACVRELQRCVTDGGPARGYFLWSFLDNFEWQDGYARRFGIVYTDFATQKRTPKLSAQWFSEVARRNALV